MINGTKIKAEMKKLGQPNYRLTQIFQAIYQQGAASVENIRLLPAALRNQLKGFPIVNLQPVKTEKLPGATKLALKTADGFLIEAVAIRMRDYYTVCLSTQIGCPLQCCFCKSGSVPFKRNLTAEEIVDQFQLLFHEIKQKPRNVVLMGMGEPLLNFESSLKALDFLHDAQRWNIGQRQMTISTAGVKGMISKLVRAELHPRLAVSLHAPNQKIRAQIMPAAKAFNLNDLLAEIREYQRASKHQTTYEYIMLNGINDQPYHAEELAKLLNPADSMINLIPYNNVFAKYKPSSPEQIKKFAGILRRTFRRVTVRQSAGEQIAAACGQLAYR